MRLKFVYKGNKNIEALHLSTAAETKKIRAEIAALKKEGSGADTEAKIKKLEEKEAALKKNCQDKTAQLRQEMEEDARKNKARFSQKA